MKTGIPVILTVVLFLVVLVVILGTRKEESPGMIIASGTVEATEVEISSKVAGQLQYFPFGEGEEVDSGEVIARLDHKELDSQLRVAHSQVKLAQAQLNQAHANLDNLSLNLKRVKELLASGSATQKQLDDISAQHKIAASQLRAAEAQLESAKANVNLLETQIENTTLTSPVSGVVLSRNVEQGEVVFPGTSLLTVGDLSSVWVKVYISEADLGKIRLNQKVEVYTDSYPQRAFEGEIRNISNRAEFTPKSVQTIKERVKLVFAVKVRMDNPEGVFKPGMFVDVAIGTGLSHGEGAAGSDSQ